MTLEAPMRCSALAEALGEPMAGTADERRRWLLLEDRSAWGTDAVADRFGADAAAEAKRLRMRLLLIRRREGEPGDDHARRAFLVDTLTGEMAVRTVEGPGELSVGEVAEMPLADFGAPATDPLVLVCTNGRRDACCALRGRILMAPLAGDHGERLWECTHLGGHRFAGNLVLLPHGIVYGRVGPGDGPRLVDGYLAGRLEPAFLRGRSAWPAPAQVAEVELRGQLGLDRVDDLELLHSTVEGQTARVRFRAGGDELSLELRAERHDPRPISCRADEPEAPLHWQVVTPQASLAST